MQSQTRIATISNAKDIV